MKKLTAILFLVLVIVVSFVGCSASSDEDTSSNSSMALDWVQNRVEQKDSGIYTGLSMSSWFESREMIEDYMSSLDDDLRPSFYSFQQLSSPNEDAYFQIRINFESNALSDELPHLIEDKCNTYLIFKTSSYAETKKEIDKYFTSVSPELKCYCTPFKFSANDKEEYGILEFIF